MKNSLKVIIISILILSFTSAQNFTNNITASSSDGIDFPLTFGMEEGATDGFDLGIDQYGPPAPPTGFDAALTWGGDRYYTQILAPSTSETTMPIAVRDLYSLSWDPTAYSSAGQFTLTDNFGGEFLSIDMSSTGYVDSSSTPMWSSLSEFLITFTATAPEPTADFSASPLIGSAPLDVSFTDLSVPGGESGSSGISLTITGSSGDGVETPLTFGMSPEATDSYDEGIDEYAPPAPPSGFDAALLWNNDRYYTQILAPSTAETVMAIQVNELYSLSWDPAAYSSAGQFTLTDNFGGVFLSIDMSTTGYVDESSSPQWSLMSTFQITFTANSIEAPANGSNDLRAGDIVSWYWEFGDGGTSGEQDPNYTYTTPGLYSVTLTVTDEDGLEDTMVKEDFITVVGPPMADFEASPMEGDAPLTVYFNDTSTPSGGDGLFMIELLTDDYGEETTWDLVDENGMDLESDGPFDSDTFYTWEFALDAGNYTWTIYDSYGDGVCCDWGVGYYNLYLDGEMIATGGEFLASESVIFSADGRVSSISRGSYAEHHGYEKGEVPADFDIPIFVETTEYSNRNGEIVSWDWDFGDGGTSDEQNPDYTYNNIGVYTVSLRVTDVDGFWAQRTKVDYIVVSEPTYSEPDLYVAEWGNDTSDGTYDNPFATIQWAVDQPIPEGEWKYINVYPGIYLETVEISNQNLTIRNAEVEEGEVIIDGQETGSVVTFSASEGFNLNLENINIVGGYAENGGGIHIDGVPHVYLLNTNINHNTAAQSGGGLYTNGAFIYLENVVFENNSCLSDVGGGAVVLFNVHSNPIFKNCLFKSNTATNGSGGAVNVVESNFEFIECTFKDNIASKGGAIAVETTPGSESVIKKSSFYENIANWGGAVHTKDSEVRFFGVNMVSNPASIGGALFGRDGSDILFLNSILGENGSPQVQFGGEGEEENRIIISYNDIEGGSSAINGGGNTEIVWLSGNFDLDPLWEDPDNDEYQLQPGSPCIDAGTDLFVFEGDTLFNLYPAQFSGSAPDIGRYEFYGELPLQASFVADVVEGDLPLGVYFTDQSGFFEIGSPCDTGSGPNSGFRDCDGLCQDNYILEWVDDGWCDEGVWDQYGPFLNCEEFDFEGGDCEDDNQSSDPDFTLTISGFSSEGFEIDLTLGMTAGATNGYDDDIDHYAPPSPPSGFDVALSDGVDRYYTQMLAPSTDMQTLYLQVQELAGGSWDLSAAAEAGNVYVSDVFVPGPDGFLFGCSDGLGSEGCLDMADPYTLGLMNDPAALEQINSAGTLELSIFAANESVNLRNLADTNTGSGKTPSPDPDKPPHHPDSQRTTTIMSWDWSFGDGNSSSDQYPYHIYENSGYFTVSLTVSDDSGNSDTKTKVNYINTTGVEEFFTWHVSTNGSDETGTGESNNPLASIQHAIYMASNGHEILVLPGTYIENINFEGKNIEIYSDEGPENTIIDGNQDGSVVTFDSGEDTTAVLNGFTLQNGFNSYGGGVLIDNSSPTITNVTISGNIGGNQGGGIWSGSSFTSSPTFTNVTISGNHASYNGGGIYCSASSPTLTNVTISGNNAQAGGGIYLRQYSNVSVLNTIFWDNSPEEIFIASPQLPSTITVSYSDVQGGQEDIVSYDNAVIWEDGNIDVDPFFVDAENGDFSLYEDSPCIDAGDPDFENDPDGTAADMGAYFFDQSGQPTRVQDLITTPGSNHMLLNWYQSSDVQGYKIYRSTDASVDFYNLSVYATTSDTVYMDTDVDVNETYHYRVSAVNSLGAEGLLSFREHGRLNASATALKLNSGDSFIILPVERISFGSDSLTFELYVRPDSSERDTMVVWQIGDPRLLLVRETPGIYRARMEFSGGSIDSDELLPEGTWHHLVITATSDENTTYLKLWVDGHMEGNSSWGDQDGDDFDAIYIGGNGGQFDGTIEEFRISSLRYTGGFIPPKEFYNDANTGLLWHFNEGSSDNVFPAVYDASGHGSHGIISGNPQWVTGAPFLEEDNEIVINEIMRDPVSVDDGVGEWFEIYNQGFTPIHFEGWTVTDNSSESVQITGVDLVVLPHQFLVFGVNQDTLVNGGVHVDYAINGFTLGNISDQITLLDGMGGLIDNVSYNSSENFPNDPGKSMELIFPEMDNDEGENWVSAIVPYGDGDFGSPGRDNDAFAGNIEFSVSTIEFDSLRVGYSVAQQFTITNTGYSSLQISSVVIEPDSVYYYSTDDSSGVIQVGDSVTMMVTFEPPAEGVHTAVLSILSNDPDEGEEQLSLSGTGIAANIDVDTATIDFEDLRINTSDTTTFVVSNPGTDTLHVTAVLEGGVVYQFSPSEGTLAPEQNQEITVIFTPVEEATYSDLLTITSDALNDSIRTVSLAGNGIKPTIEISESELNFDDVSVYSDSTLMLTIQNIGSDTLIIDTLYTTSELFTIVDGGEMGSPGRGLNSGLDTRSDGMKHTANRMHNTTIKHFSKKSTSKITTNNMRLNTRSMGQIPPGESLEYLVSFAPLDTGNVSAELYIESDDPDNLQTTLPLSGTGISGGIVLSVTQLNFGNVSQDTIQITVTNTGTDELTITNITQAEPPEFFVSFQDSILATSIPPQESAVLFAYFTPSSVGHYTGTATIISNAFGEQAYNISLDAFYLVDQAIDFGQVFFDKDSVQTLSLENNGNALVSIVAVATFSEVFSDSILSEEWVINPGSTLDIELTFAPGTEGTYTDSMEMVINGLEDPQTFFNLTGVGITYPSAVYSNLSLGVVTLHGIDISFDVEMSNEGDYPLDYGIAVDATWFGEDWLSVSPLEGQILGGGIQTLSCSAINMNVLEAGTYSGSIIITTNSGEDLSSKSDTLEVELIQLPTDGVIETVTLSIPPTEVDALGVGFNFIDGEAGTVTVTYIESVPPSDGSTPYYDPNETVSDPVYAVIFWEIETTIPEGFVVDIIFSYADLPGIVDPSQLRLAKRVNHAGTGDVWEFIASEEMIINETLQTITVLAQTDFSQWTVASDGSTNSMRDIIPPNISQVLSQPLEPLQNVEDVTVSAVITDESDYESIELSYRIGNSANVNQIPMNQIGNTNQYEGVIPASDVTLSGIAYAISARDELGQESTTNLIGIRVTVPSDVVQSSLYQTAFEYGFPKDKWRLFSVPLNLMDDNPTVTANIEDDFGTSSSNTSWLLYKHTADPFGNPVWVDAEQLMPGESYWLYQMVQNNMQFSVGSGKTEDITGYSLLLNSGWNLISSPFTFPIPSFSLDQNKFYGPITYGNEGEGWSGVESELIPWAGYAIFNKFSDSDTAWIQPISDEGMARESTISEDDWMIKLSARGEVYTDVANYIGRAEGASDELDYRDNPEPPYMEKYVSLTMLRPDWSSGVTTFTSDIRSLEEFNGVWDIDLLVKGESNPISITRELMGEFPSDMVVVILNLVERQTTNLLSDDVEITVSNYPSGYPYHLKVIAGTEDFVNLTIEDILSQLPESFALNQNYPNPFNPTTTIKYALPEPSLVRLTVYNILGQELITLVNGWKDIGYHQTVWNGKDRSGREVSSGMYLSVFETSDRVITRKMVLLR